MKTNFLQTVYRLSPVRVQALSGTRTTGKAQSSKASPSGTGRVSLEQGRVFPKQVHLKRRQKMYILYQGPSTLDGKPIVAILTGPSNNRKTGKMAQVWILRSDIEPHIAAKTGDDISICGSCPLRPSRKNVCYVLTFQGPLAIYRAYKAGKYKIAGPEVLSGHAVRFGAYGDIAAVPESVARRWFDACAFHTCYTHQWKNRNVSWLKGLSMASVESDKDTARARADGWATFRVTPSGQTGPLARGEIACPYQVSNLQCIDCKLCDGARINVLEIAHGSRSKNLA